MVDYKNILITGGAGQLGKSIKDISDNYNYNFIFKSKKELDITKNEDLNFFDINKIDVIINCAAYTDVNMAESKKEIADLVNDISVDKISTICKQKKIMLIHISTDYVFDGIKREPYKENESTNPLNYYGLSKLKGEKRILNHKLKNSIIIRTSWLYSKYKNNFVLKLLKKIEENKSICVTDNEWGSPTNASDLAKAILEIIPKISNKKTEIYHFSNLGVCSRFEFANKINDFAGGSSVILVNSSTDLGLKRPEFSALNSQKIMNDFEIRIENWLTSLKKYFANEIQM